MQNKMLPTGCRVVMKEP